MRRTPQEKKLDALLTVQHSMSGAIGHMWNVYKKMSAACKLDNDLIDPNDAAQVQRIADTLEKIRAKIGEQTRSLNEPS